MNVVTRFAPSPSGPLHLGHVYAARVARDLGKGFLLRIEDLDRVRSKPQWEAGILADLHWLGMTWDGEIIRQSERTEFYQDALARLIALGLVYPCRCTRGDIAAATQAPQEGLATTVYPGTCRGRALGDAEPGEAVRLDVAASMALAGRFAFSEFGPRRAGRHAVTTLPEGDIVLRRRESGEFAYHLAVVVDDAAQGVTLVTRGEDLFEATGVQRLLQVLLDLPEPSYHHHALVRDRAGKRLAKRDDARAVASYRAAGLSPEHVLALAEAGITFARS